MCVSIQKEGFFDGIEVLNSRGEEGDLLAELVDEGLVFGDLVLVAGEGLLVPLMLILWLLLYIHLHHILLFTSLLLYIRLHHILFLTSTLTQPPSPNLRELQLQLLHRTQQHLQLTISLPQLLLQLTHLHNEIHPLLLPTHHLLLPPLLLLLLEIRDDLGEFLVLLL